MLALIVYPIYALNNNEAFYWGGHSNFVKDTMLTMLQELMQVRVPSVAHGFILSFIIFTALVTFYFLAGKYLRSRRTLQQTDSGIFIIPFLFVLCIACINIQFYFLSIKFVIFRTALYLYPLFILSLFAALKLIGEKSRMVLPGTIAAIVSLNFAFTFNIKYAFEAVSNSYTLEVLSDISSSEPTEKTIRLFSSLYEEPCLNYYISNGMSDRFSPVPFALLERSDLHEYDHLLLSGEDTYKAPPYYKQVKMYGDRELFLYKNTERN